MSCATKASVASRRVSAAVQTAPASSGWVLAGGLGCGLRLVDQTEGGLALVHHLAAHKVHRLYAVGTFVDRRHPHIAAKLRRTGFFDKAHAAMHLHSLMRHLAAGVGAVGLGNR